MTVRIINDDSPEGREIVALGNAFRRTLDRGVQPSVIEAADKLLEACRRVRDGLDRGEHPGKFASILDEAITLAEH